MSADLTVLVTDENDAPIRSTGVVRLQRLSGGSSMTLNIDSQGFGRYTNLEEGDYSITVEVSCFETKTVRFHVTDNLDNFTTIKTKNICGPPPVA